MSKDIFDDLDALRLSPEAMSNNGVAKEILSQVPVRKPNRHEFFRIHPDPNMSLATSVYMDKEARETFLVTPSMRDALLGEAKAALVVTGITRQNVLFLWPLAFPNETGRSNSWNESAREACELAKVNWVRMAADMNLKAYRIYRAEGELSEPNWPNRSLNELLEIGFRGRILGTEDHPVVKRLRGLS